MSSSKVHQEENVQQLQVNSQNLKRELRSLQQILGLLFNEYSLKFGVFSGISKMGIKGKFDFPCRLEIYRGEQPLIIQTNDDVDILPQDSVDIIVDESLLNAFLNKRNSKNIKNTISNILAKREAKIEPNLAFKIYINGDGLRRKQYFPEINWNDEEVKILLELNQLRRELINSSPDLKRALLYLTRTPIWSSDWSDFRTMLDIVRYRKNMSATEVSNMESSWKLIDSKGEESLKRTLEVLKSKAMYFGFLI